MKKNKNNNFFGKKSSQKSHVEPSKPEVKSLPKVDSLDEDDQGFGGWLRSSDGMDNMKLFVIANTLVITTTLIYPHLQTVYEIISESIYGTETDF